MKEVLSSTVQLLNIVTRVQKHRTHAHGTAREITIKCAILDTIRFARDRLANRADQILSKQQKQLEYRDDDDGNATSTDWMMVVIGDEHNRK